MTNRYRYMRADYSYAGYMANEEPIPDVRGLVADVTNYGAIGDGKTDCTAAFKKAIASIHEGVVYVPPGTYLLMDQLVISNSGVVLRGAGAGASTLFFNTSLTGIYGQSWSGHGTEASIQSDYKDGPGLIRFAGPRSYNLAGEGHVQIGVEDPVSDSTLLTTITRPALRGQVKLMVADSSRLLQSQWVTIVLSDRDSAMVSDMYGNITVSRKCRTDCINAQRTMRFHSRIYSVREGYIVLERPLPFNVSTLWNPEVHAFQPGIQQSGIEKLTVLFRWSRYAEHLMEEGFNGIEFAGAANCWARDLIISNSDNHIIIWKSSFITVTNITYTRQPSRGGAYDCHHAVNVTWSQDVAITNSLVHAICVHDLASFAWNNAVVFANITGPFRLNMDHHSLMPYATLWSNINVGRGDRAFKSGGEVTWGMQSAAYTTYYNIKASRGMVMTSFPSIYNGPLGNFLDIAWNPNKLLALGFSSEQGWLVKGVVSPTGPQANPEDLLSAMILTRDARFQRLGRQDL
ncbi:hypothetical protein CEUSTIGMA_g11615.t1 [Chlamydomonas eustigma]|uniref:Rhamnogalacturonase A/B/Epimerase-like pectate lyase domain-containing protein n=1 Tax=Chlamydomonas eustigma TaxID=1157962 RepID=A0A250XMR5_9CHLO|nr:hypothetical protein CEUSTIGMA_g11615.t1 [Chlamydomonas eustigma]|eukprot:GAX84192.1 hypothetical protein CEUSTIGMA_g11615.t1 [Chlamydomonas eustigma]